MNQKSFTLIEILTVILIVGVLSGIIIVATNSVIDSTQDAKRKKDLDSISKALMEYGIMTGSYPVEASDCNIGDGTCLDELIDTGYTKNFPLDPSGSRYKYTSDGTTYTIKALLSDNQTLAYNPDTGYSQYTGLVGYTKRKSITINSSASLTDYQVKVDVTYDSDMQADFDDLRFTLSDGATELSYWLESKTDSASAVFWVKVPSLSIGDNTIYAYYGNASASSSSNGDNTFEFFDGFEGSEINTSKWSFRYGSLANGKYNVSSSFINITNSPFHVCHTFSSSSFAIRLKGYYNNGTYYCADAFFNMYNTTFSNRGASSGYNINANEVWISETNGTGHDVGNCPTSLTIIEIRKDGTNISAYQNDTQLGITYTNTNLYEKICMGSDTSGTYNCTDYHTDWILVRKYTPTEPSVSSWGSEESI